VTAALSSAETRVRAARTPRGVQLNEAVNLADVIGVLVDIAPPRGGRGLLVPLPGLVSRTCVPVVGPQLVEDVHVMVPDVAPPFVHGTADEVPDRRLREVIRLGVVVNVVSGGDGNSRGEDEDSKRHELTPAE
jgi:hypothetical protein